jgi:two-component system, OmpR family, response regulator ChvI
MPSLSAAPATLALVDDDQNILMSLAIALQAAGYTIRQYSDGTQALPALKSSPATLGVFDIKMPRMDGLTLLKELRQFSDMPVIFLTSKDDEADEAEGFNTGADDYIVKPFSQKLLLARIAAVLRRTQARAQLESQDSTKNQAIKRGDLEMDAACHHVRWKGQEVVITVSEFLILEALAQRPNVVKSRDALMDIAYSDDIYVDERTIDSHIKRLRRKFRAHDPEFNAIETLYGAGYRFTA